MIQKGVQKLNILQEWLFCSAGRRCSSSKSKEEKIICWINDIKDENNDEDEIEDHAIVLNRTDWLRIMQSY